MENLFEMFTKQFYPQNNNKSPKVKEENGF